MHAIGDAAIDQLLHAYEQALRDDPRPDHRHRIEHFGMPVDPGNLLLVGVFSEGATKKHVLGAPGCARSPKENGFDWVLHRLLAGVEVTSGDIKRMGAGGLLMEIVQRGHPRGGEAQSAHE